MENTKTAKAQEITSLKKRVNRLEKKGGSRTHKLKRLYKIGRSARVVSSDEAKITLVDESQGRHDDDDLMFVICVLNDEEVFAGKDIWLKRKLVLLKSARPKTRGVVMQDLSESIITTTTTISSKEKGKGIMVEEPLKIETDYEMAQRLQAEEQEELTIKEKSKLFVQLLEARKKHFAAKRAEEKRNRPPIKAQ
ncbi:hypothetical protein Tco_1140588 [Tanacetum coccineum]